MIASLCLFGTGNIPYIDALFLACGAATQSGLNTIDLNLLNTWQQVVIYVIPMITNPITINTYVVFLRLWWFEKKFQHVVKEARRGRRSISKTISRTKNHDREYDREERAISDRENVAMHDRYAHNGAILPRVPVSSPNIRNKSQQLKYPYESKPIIENRGRKRTTEKKFTEDIQRQIKFVDQLMQEEDVTRVGRLPIPRSKDENIAFLQRQRNAERGEVLRIPGPREADAGIPPHRISDNSDPVYVRRNSSYYVDDDTEFSSSYRQSSQNLSNSKSSINISMSPVSEDFMENNNNRRRSEGTPQLQGQRNSFPCRRVDGWHESSLQKFRSIISRDKNEANLYLSWQPTIKRNSAFPNLTAEQRDELGGIEYRSLKTLAVVLVLYFWAFSFFGVICLIPWILKDKLHSQTVTGDGIGRVWWGIFTANSAFTDLGFTLTPDSMISFQLATWPLLIMSFLIIIGNAAFPIMLRIIIWIGSQISPRGSGVQQELNFLLDHPRRCFTLLFPAKATLWLATLLIIMSSIDLFFFIVLDVCLTRKYSKYY